MCCHFHFCQVDDGAVLESPMEGPSRRSMRQRSVSNNAERSPVPESRSKREKVVSASPERPPSTGFVRRSTRVHKPVQPFQAHPNTRYVVTASAKLNFASIFFINVIHLMCRLMGSFWKITLRRESISFPLCIFNKCCI